MAKLGRDDWFSLMVITGQNKSLAGQEFADRADLLISDMEDAGQLPDAPMFEEWANHANIQTLADAEWFLRMVWWCASPATVSDELFATLMKRMSQKHDLEAIVKLYRQAVSSNRAGERTHFRMMKSYARLGAATKAITMFEEHFAERSSDEECSLLIKGTSHETALKLFNWIKKKKVAGPKTYERIIRVYCLSHLLPEASALCKEWTLEKQAPPTPAMFNALMWAYIRRGDSEAKDFVQEVEQSGEYLPMKSLEALMHLLGRKGDVDGALEILFRVEELSPGAMRTVWTYNIALGILARARTTDRFHEILDHMKQQNVEPDPVTYGTIMSGFNKCGRHQNVIDLFHFLMSKDMALNHAAISAVLMSLATLRRIEDMLTCFNGLRDNRRHELTVKHYTIVIDAYLKQGDLATAYEIFDVMAKDHKSPDVVTYSCFLDAYGRRDDLRGITKILNAMDSNQVVADAVVYNILIMAHSRRSRAKQALQAFADMITKDLKPSIYTYSAVVYALAKDGDFTACDELLVEMESVGVWPNSYTYAILIKEMMIRGDRQGALRYFNRYAPTGMDPAVDHRPKPRFDAKLSNTILRGLMQLNDIENALSVFKQLMHLGHMPTITEWMTIIEGVGKAGLVAECEGLYRRFLQLGKQEEGGGTKAEKGHVAPTLWACRKARQHVVAALVAKEGEAGVKEFVRREREGWKDLGPVDIFGIDLTPETM
ncbi:uncharacterized protein EV422DRAFT_570053 [Fimicolochytrium jonesii]|uniref:uncharacterized protein n=1 Tax=Fimicolochytrium jonesii TaxID=1396493 RepID=UPI0022FEC290|nr:uncharacterized protein EV422DRAFT_570053 [Fimicolochytrium jonesii]KAI8817900.1 hypothetical protein EV422DRAFT_570053 [Fimicolochytrium jonesii]